MIVKKLLKTLAIIVVLMSNIGCDQISKKIVRQRIEYHEQIGLLGNYFTITKIENTGAFLSLGSSLAEPTRQALLTILPAIALSIGLIYLLLKRNLSNLRILGLSSIIGGGIGNIYGRIIFGSVTDFLHIDFALFQTGIFNMADVSIVFGASIILLDSYFAKKELNIEKKISG